MFDLSAPPEGFVENPFPHYDRLLREAPMLRQPDGSVLICRHADLNAIYRDTTLYISDKKLAFAPKFGPGSPLFEHHTTSLVFNDPPLHTRVRRIMTSALTPKALARMEPGLIDTVDRLLEGLSPTPDLIEDYASCIPVQIIGNLLDVPMEERGPLRNWSLAILGALEPTLSDAELEAGHTAVREFKAYLQDLIARRRAAPGDPETDVLTRLIAGDDGGQLTEIELIQNCIFILNAGHETTTNLIGSALALLHDHPDQKARLLAEPALIGPCIEEVLRFRSPNQFGNRETTAPVTIGGVEIAAGSNLHLCIGAANRDPEVFEAPTKFDIERKPNRHLAFAGGPHVCVGLTLARMEGKIALQRFLNRYPDYEISAARQGGGRIRFHGYATLPARLN
ncbi:cytochrome P450 [Sulfitobacter sp. KE34]|mgnify:FL=1|uniref:Cytochrome P450 n=1 Tax=Sulfitobacter faviae TaxID=1775881 RepID=A0AAX3LLJ1_9RHOB|nr:MULTISPECIES: cytochrome P450 [Sulfitobacter]MDF3348966.1 cytochrome P450 [Sulfitobacter sp. KE12]MDF3352637.1 cytochrome P450 [Sulfitobacter sp. KE27]MDF3356284.1 cytochrome P450 [Sulfitobacter sp. KE33]MDF3360712.1 cytochrome P450 [Sulfitobacter sp. Ks41]MDF3363708.1 cytochrome P450 [Sulfitobacter sp. Ks34]